MPWQSFSDDLPRRCFTPLALSITNHLTVISRSLASPLLGAPWAQQFTQYDIMWDNVGDQFPVQLELVAAHKYLQHAVDNHREKDSANEREREKEAELENRINIQNNANFACHCCCCCCCNCKRETRRLRKVSQREDNAVYLIDAPHCIAPERHWAAKPQATASALGLCLVSPSFLPSLTLCQLWQTVVTV